MEKIALVTGGNSGIGYATARLLIEKGYEVYISGRDKKTIYQRASEINAKPLTANMGKSEDLIEIASLFREQGLDVLVNNAGISLPKPITELTHSDFDNCFNINVRGPLLLIKELVPALEKRSGVVVNISSVITKKGTLNGSLYAATKGSIDAFTKSLALELAPRKIRINAVAPGPIDTPLFEKMGLNPNELAKKKQIYQAMIPMQRFGRADEVAQVVLAQIDSTYVTGSIWDVDGGFSA